MSKLLKRKLTAQLPELAIALDTAPPPTEREIEAARVAVHAERDRLKQVEKRAVVISCVLIAVAFVVTFMLIPAGQIAGAFAFAFTFAVVGGSAVVGAVVGAIAFTFAGVVVVAVSVAGGGAGVGAIAGAIVGAIAGAAAVAVDYLQKQYNRLYTFEQSLETAIKEACIQILAWQKDPVIAAYCAKVVAERQFITAEVEAMRVWVEAAEQRKAVAEKQAKVDEACRALYRTA